MGYRGIYGYMRDMEPVVVEETTFNGSSPAYDASGSFLLKTISLDVQETREPRMDTTGHRSTHSMLRKRRTNGFNFTSHLDPPGGATVPDLGPFIKAAMGSETIGGSDVTYALAEIPPSLAVRFVQPGVCADDFRGVAVQTMRLSGSGTEETSIEFGCTSATHIETGVSVLDADTTSGASTSSVAAGQEVNFELGSIITVGADGPHVVDSISSGSVGYSASTVGSTIASGSVIGPFSHFSTASIASYQSVFIGEGGFDLGTELDIELSEFELTVDNQQQPFEPVFNRNPSDFSIGRRVVSGSLGIWMRDVDSLRWMRARQASGNELAVAIRLGDTASAGNPLCTINLPRCYFNFPEKAPEEDGVTKVTLPFVALTSSLSVGDSEMTMVFGTTT